MISSLVFFSCDSPQILRAHKYPFCFHLLFELSAFHVTHLQTDTPASLWSTGTIPC